MERGRGVSSKRVRATLSHRHTHEPLALQPRSSAQHSTNQRKKLTQHTISYSINFKLFNSYDDYACASAWAWARWHIPVSINNWIFFKLTFQVFVLNPLKLFSCSFSPHSFHTYIFISESFFVHKSVYTLWFEGLRRNILRSKAPKSKL